MILKSLVMFIIAAGLLQAQIYSQKENLLPLSFFPSNQSALWMSQLKTIVQEADPLAFMVIGQAHEALGEGFQPLKT